MGKTDSLSRRLDWEVGVEKDNENEMLVKPEWLKNVENREIRNHCRKSGFVKESKVV